MSKVSIAAASSSIPSVIAVPKSQRPATPAHASRGAALPGTRAPQSAVTAGAAVSVAVAALKEATETSAQTASEAAGGDRQAQKLLAKAADAAAALGGGGGRALAAITHGDAVGTQLDVKA